MKTIKVACGIIWNDKKVFIARRKPEKHLGGYWEFPGGKVESNETPEASLKRELYEELGMEVNIVKHFLNVIYEYENFTIELISFHCLFLNASYKLNDHDKLEWINIQELIVRKLAPADIVIVNELLKDK